VALTRIALFLSQPEVNTTTETCFKFVVAGSNKDNSPMGQKGSVLLRAGDYYWSNDSESETNKSNDKQQTSSNDVTPKQHVVIIRGYRGTIGVGFPLMLVL
jgi:hypothetical protein